jgi:putative oxidoreductase
MIGMHRWGATVLRVVLGVVFIMHGYLGYAVLGPSTMAGYITRMGFPANVAPVLAWYGIAAHLLGGALLVLGLWTRWAAAANVPVIAAAFFLLHLRQGYFMKVLHLGDRQVVGGYELTFVVLGATIAAILLGGGAASLDAARQPR